MSIPKITPCLWFDNQAEAAARFYTSVFKKGKIGKITRFGKRGLRDPRTAGGIGHDGGV